MMVTLKKQSAERKNWRSDNVDGWFDRDKLKPTKPQHQVQDEDQNDPSEKLRCLDRLVGGMLDTTQTALAKSHQLLHLVHDEMVCMNPSVQDSWSQIWGQYCPSSMSLLSTSFSNLLPQPPQPSCILWTFPAFCFYRTNSVTRPKSLSRSYTVLRPIQHSRSGICPGFA